MTKEFAEERREKIYQYLKENKRANVSEMAKKFSVTEVTIRRDLIAMENKKNDIIRTHGGAILKSEKVVSNLTTLKSRMEIAKKEKKRIAQYIATRIEDNDSLFIDSGSSTLEVAYQLLQHSNLLIVTTSLQIVQILSGVNNNRVIVPEGEYNKDTDYLLGSDTQASMKRYHVDKAILSFTGAIANSGFFSANQHETSIKKIMIENSQESIICLDSTKIDNYAFSFICPIEDVSLIVTDKGISSEALESFKEKGPEIIVV
ncbi:MAG: DeoR/GlpR family DNA-binding transcription regulator [Sphaerochaetaceae bacterium]|nr:DeoR/GlpR family DNA-binding transcription regulator [Sphaerochaetaceae bacterium]